MKRNDIFATIIIAEADAWLIILILKNIGGSFALIWLSPLVLPILAIFGLVISYFIGKRILSVFQLYKFALVGSLNTFIDLGVLNLLMLISGMSAGLYYSAFKGLSYIVATTNSYFWNKFWSFENKETAISPKEITQFFVISGTGFLINVAVASLVVNLVGPQFGMSLKLWANLGAITATFVGMGWNFLGYKFLVFKK